MDDYLPYPLRRVLWWLMDPAPACIAKGCARPVARQGLIASVWCARHNSRIMGGEAWETWLR